MGFFNERKLVMETRKAVFSQPDGLQICDGRAFQHKPACRQAGVDAENETATFAKPVLVTGVLSVYIIC